MRIARPGDFWSGLALAGLGTYVVSEAWGWLYMGPDGPGAGFFPLWYGTVMVVLSLWLVAQSVRVTRVPGEPIDWSAWRRPLACWVALVAAIALLRVAGFFIAFTLLTWFVIAVMFRRPQRLAWLVALGGSALFELVFDVGLGLSLPQGLWH